MKTVWRMIKVDFNESTQMLSMTLDGNGQIYTVTTSAGEGADFRLPMIESSLRAALAFIAGSFGLPLPAGTEQAKKGTMLNG